jgi:hypothetical protein
MNMYRRAANIFIVILTLVFGLGRPAFGNVTCKKLLLNSSPRLNLNNSIFTSVFDGQSNKLTEIIGRGDEITENEQTYLRLIEASLKQNFIGVEDLQKLVTVLEGRETEAAKAQAVTDGNANHLIANQRPANQMHGVLPNPLQAKTLTASSLPYFNAFAMLKEQNSINSNKNSINNILRLLENTLWKTKQNLFKKSEAHRNHLGVFNPHLTRKYEAGDGFTQYLDINNVQKWIASFKSVNEVVLFDIKEGEQKKRITIKHKDPPSSRFQFYRSKDGQEYLIWSTWQGKIIFLNINNPKSKKIIKIENTQTGGLRLREYFITENGHIFLPVIVSAKYALIFDISDMSKIKKYTITTESISRGKFNINNIGYFQAKSGKEKLMLVTSCGEVHVSDFNNNFNSLSFEVLKMVHGGIISAPAGLPRYFEDSNNQEYLISANRIIKNGFWYSLYDANNLTDSPINVLVPTLGEKISDILILKTKSGLDLMAYTTATSGGDREKKVCFINLAEPEKIVCIDIQDNGFLGELHYNVSEKGIETVIVEGQGVLYFIDLFSMTLQRKIKNMVSP